MTEFRLTHAMRWFGLLIGWGCCILNFSCTSERQPNIVFILTDDQGYGDLGVYGATDIQTPHLDRLALEGAYFTSYYATQPVCSASRASILTGCYSDRIGIFNAFGPESNLGIKYPLERLRYYQNNIHYSYHTYSRCIHHFLNHHTPPDEGNRDRLH